jgi:hypothetical protein
MACLHPLARRSFALQPSSADVSQHFRTADLSRLGRNPPMSRVEYFSYALSTSVSRRAEHLQRLGPVVTPRVVPLASHLAAAASPSPLSSTGVLFVAGHTSCARDCSRFRDTPSRFRPLAPVSPTPSLGACVHCRRSSQRRFPLALLASQTYFASVESLFFPRATRSRRSQRSDLTAR